MDAIYSNAGPVWALGVTQIIGYGTLYYSISILALDIAVDLDVALEWIYGCISLALLAGGSQSWSYQVLSISACHHDFRQIIELSRIHPNSHK